MDNQFDNQNNPQPNTDSGNSTPDNTYGQTPDNQGDPGQPANPYSNPYTSGGAGTGENSYGNPQNNMNGSGLYNGGYGGNAVPPNPNNNYQYNTGGYQEENPKSNMATASLVLGIVSAVMLCFCTGFNIIAAIVSIILGFLSKGNAKKLPGNAKAGIIISIIVIVLTIILIIFSMILLADYANNPDFINFMEQFTKFMEENSSLIFLR